MKAPKAIGPHSSASQKNWAALFACSSAIALITMGSAHAQTAEQPETPPPAQDSVPAQAEAPAQNDAPAQDAAPMKDIVVTGSRIARAGFTAPTPTTVIGAEDLERKAVGNAAELLNTLPAFRASVTPSVTTVSQSIGANYLDLRGLGISRTLVLVNNQRYAPSNISGQVDLNLIPSIMIGRTEVVTGGASAAYGSDAVAGVVNLIYKQDVEGIQGTVRAGQSSHGDNKEIDLGLLYGTRFAGGRGHFMIGAQYVDNKGGDELGSRDWGRKDWNIIPNPNATAANGEPTRLLVQNVRNSNQTLGGLIRSPGTLAGTQFLSGGVPAPFNFGTLVGPTFMVGGDGVNTQRWVLLKAPLERYAIAAKADFEITPSIKLKAEYTYGHEEHTSKSGQSQDQSLIVQRDNAFLPTSVRDAMVAANANTITIGRRSADLFPDNSLKGAPIYGETTLHRGAISLEGDLGAGWKWDAYYQHGDSKNIQQIGLRHRANWARAIDAVVNPANGAVVCRSTLSADPVVRAAAAGCVPFNIFGPYSRSLEAADYVSGFGINTLRFKQDVAAAQIQGEPFSIWGGPVSIAFGGEYRRDKASSTVDEISLVKGFDLLNFQPISGTSKVMEGFFETVAPILSDKPLVKLLEFNGAVRYTNYSLSGSVTTWKAGLTYIPFDGLRFRATRSRDIRAPNINELFSPLQGTLQTVMDANGQSVPTQINTGGNLNLVPEFADTTTFGVVLSPSFLPGFQASVDFYDINIKDAIATLAPADIVSRCASGTTNLCDRIVRDGTGRLVSIDQVFENLASARNRGVDFEVSYRRDLNSIWSKASGNLTVRLLASYTDMVRQDDGKVAIDLAGDTGGRRPGGLPKWSGTSIIAYDNGPLKLSTEVRYISRGKLDALGTPQNLNINHVASRTYVSLSGAYEILSSKEDGKRLEIFGTVNNLFDTDPPVSVSPNAFPTNAILFDTIGRNFSVGVRFAF